jgi:ABC-type branched-subunit amino acid transport system substrate-binding protein
MRRMATIGAVAVVAVLVLGACRDGDDGPAASGDGDGVTWDAGVTEEPCPDTPNQDNGCIYLGTLTDLTGPFAGFGGPLTAAQAAFWERVNSEGGITADGVDMAFDVDVTTYSESSGYDPTEHSRLYEEMKPEILALAQTLGTPTTLAILDDMKASDLVAAPAGYTSLFNFEDVILESSANYCVESMNSVDYAVDTYGISSVMAVHYEGDYGADAAAGVQIAAEANDLEFSSTQTVPGGENQEEAIGRILTEQPDLILVTTGPAEFGTIIGGVAREGIPQGYTPRIIGTNPTWNPALLANPDLAEAVTALVQVGGAFPNWSSDTPAHEAMRAAIGEPEDLNDGYTAGWMWQYPIKAVLEAALANEDLTRAGVRAAAMELTSVDYEGMLPASAGNYAGGAEAQLRQTLINNPDPEAPTGLTAAGDFFAGPTVEAWTPAVCFQDFDG